MSGGKYAILSERYGLYGCTILFTSSPLLPKYREGAKKDRKSVISCYINGLGLRSRHRPYWQIG